MADSSEEEDNEPFVFYRDREEWKDMTPVPQDDGPHPVVAIAYTEKCRNIISAFWFAAHDLVLQAI